MKCNANEFADWLIEKAKEKDGYIMCAIGQDPKKLNAWYFDQYKDNDKQYKQALYWKEHAPRVFDCQGMADGYLTETLGTKIDVRARNNYADWCNPKGTGKIPSEYRVRGAAVFIHNGDYVSHVGFLVQPVNDEKPDGDWYVVEARGVMYGVVITKLNDRTWNRWGLMTKYFDYGKLSTTSKEYTLGERALSKGVAGNDVSELQRILVKLGFNLGKYGENKDGVDGEYGEKTVSAIKTVQKYFELEKTGVYDDVVHGCLMQYLDNNSDTADKEQSSASIDDVKHVVITSPGSWYVRKGNGTTYDAITTVREGDKFEWVATATNGWNAFDTNGQVGWVSPKCSSVN